MKKQLLDIALPSPPRAGLNIKQTFKGVLTDNETRERWISRFSYWWVIRFYEQIGSNYLRSLHLLRHFYAEGLVDKRTFLVWLVQQMSICNLAQAGFVVRLADEYLSDVVESRALSRSFVDACLNKLHEVFGPSSSFYTAHVAIQIRSSGPAQACLVNTDALLSTLIQVCPVCRFHTI
jgi:mediator of RNA polymerase II transcription subunit 12, fungi type